MDWRKQADKMIERLTAFEHGCEREYVLGQNGVIGIDEHKAQGEGDRWHYDVEYDTGRVERLFIPERVRFIPLTGESHDNL